MWGLLLGLNSFFLPREKKGREERLRCVASVARRRGLVRLLFPIPPRQASVIPLLPPYRVGEEEGD
jgi:hypothetical protein